VVLHFALIRFSSPLVPRSIWFCILLRLGLVHDVDSDGSKIARFIFVFISLLAYCFIVLDFVTDSITSASSYELYMDSASTCGCRTRSGAARGVCVRRRSMRADRNRNNEKKESQGLNATWKPNTTPTNFRPKPSE